VSWGEGRGKGRLLAGRSAYADEGKGRPSGQLRTSMSNAARRARIAAVIKLLCDRFPQTFSRRGPLPLKIGVYADVFAALAGAVEPRDLKSALRAYTSNAGYLRALSAGAARIGLDGAQAGSVTPEDEAVAKERLADLEKPPEVKAPRIEAKPPAGRKPPPKAAGEAGAKKERIAQPGPKRLSLADLREAGRRRRGG
jgi:ProP effector